MGIKRNKPLKRKTPLKRSKPPERKVELKAGEGFTVNAKKTNPMRIGRSAKARSFDAWRAHEREAVVLRAHGYCEAWWPSEHTDGFQNVCQLPGTEVHHNFGRTNEPWSSWRAMCALLCASHHAAVTGQLFKGLDKEMRIRLRADSARRVLKVFNFADLRFRLTDDEWVSTLQGQLANYKLYGLVPPDYDEFNRRK